MVKSTIDERTGMLKQGVYIGAFIVIALFGPDLRSSMSGNSGADGLEARVRGVEIQNASHSPMREDIEHNATSIENLQNSTQKLLTQVEALVNDVAAMQEREYERWGKK